MEDKNLLQLAYKNGYKYYQYAFADLNEIKRDFILEGSGSNSWNRTVWEIEDRLGFDSENEDWDNQGIYGIIEDSSVAYEAGATDALEDNEYNPDRISFLWDN